MSPLPTAIGPIHFVGIGGIGMSGIAEVMHNLGYAVQGSDIAAGGGVERLRAHGIPVAIGHAAANLGDAAVVVVSSAINRGNPEIVAALERRLPVVRRAEMLAELMRLKRSVAVAGTHGKTTTTSMVAALLDAGGLDPTVINGGIIESYGSNARLGTSDWMVVEADESDGSFLRLAGTIAVITNIDPEHLDHYGTFDQVRAAFLQFAQQVPFYGAAVLCADHPEVLGVIARVEGRRVITYGFSPQADVRVERIVAGGGRSRFDVLARGRDGGEQRLAGLELPMPGRHNVQNAAAAIAVSLELGCSEAAIRAGFARFGGVRRRFTLAGEVRVGASGSVRVIDDYAHHPVEIRAALAAAREALAEGGQGRVIAVAQPHRFTRLRDLLPDFAACFTDADLVFVAPVYPAGEAPIAGVDAAALAEAIRARGQRHATTIAGPEALAEALAGLVAPGDMVVCLGAGDITRWAAGLVVALGDALSGAQAA